MRKTVVLFLLGVAILYLHPVGDTDVFWHLKTGELIINSLSIPEQDNFSFTTYKDLNESERPRLKYILRQYWLSETIFFVVWKIGGVLGLIIFRAIIFLLILLIISNYLKKNKLSLMTEASILLLIGLHLARYSTDRPQIFSFLFTACYIHEIESLMSGLKRPYLTLPLINLLWANMHSSALMGIFISIIYLIFIIPSLFKRNICLNSNGYIKAGILLFSILISLLNPNTYQVIPLMVEQMLQKPLHFYYNTEYMSPIERLTEMKEFHPEYWLFLIITMVFLFSRTISVLHRILLFCLMIFSLTAIRFSPFFIITAGIFVSPPFDTFLRRVRISGTEVLRVSLFLISTGLFLFTAFKHRDELLRFNVKDIYPEKAVEFIANKVMQETNVRLFNYFEWGGYIIWKQPGLKVFIDGRVLRLSVWEDYFKIAIKPDPQWNELLRKYEVNFILFPPVTPDTGMPLNILYLITGHPEWKPLYADEDSLLFARRDYPMKEIPLETVKEIILQRLRFWLEQEPNNSVRWRNLRNACLLFENRDFRSSVCRSLSP